MREGTFLGYKVNADGLKVCPDKVEAVLSLPSPKCLKDMQRLNRKLASLNRFLSKSAKKSLPFFKTLKKCTKKSDFQWTAKAEMAFKQMKKSIEELPMLIAPKEKEELIIYLAAVKEAISAVLMTERDGKQIPIYFVSHALQASFRRALAYMLIVDELPFKFVEGKGFKHFLNATQPLFHTPSRITMARDCMKLFLEEKKKVGVQLRGNVGRICLTTDTWTSLQRINYMCLTAHYIDNDWVLRKKVLNFFPIFSHRGVDIGKAVEMCLLKWGTESNVFTITVDNASANDVAVAYLKSKFSNWEKSVLEGLVILGSRLICVRAAVNIHQSNFFSPHSEDRHYRDDLEKTGVPISSDWANVRRLTKFLEHFYQITLKVSGTLYVTSNNFLDDITSIDTALSNCINGVPDKNLAAMAKMMKCKFDKYYESLEKCNMAIVVVSVLDPRNKSEYVEVLLGDVYGKIEGKSMCAMIKASLVELYEDYVRIHASPETHTIFESVDASSSMNKRSATPVIESSVILKQKVRMEMKRRKSESGMHDSKSELDRYLNEDVEDESDKFDILNWWKVNSPRFPVLSLLARDVLAIPISTVASKSVFSTDGRVLDAFRSSLTPPVVEVNLHP
ncbi:zinc finger BED domain-containing protein RICESLEEPER 2-like protein [Tanacetum coccineum]